MAATKTAKLTKSQVILALSEQTELSRKDVARVFEALSALVAKQLVGRGSPGEVTIPGLLKLKAVKNQPPKSGKVSTPSPRSRSRLPPSLRARKSKRFRSRRSKRWCSSASPGRRPARRRLNSSMKRPSTRHRRSDYEAVPRARAYSTSATSPPSRSRHVAHSRTQSGRFDLAMTTLASPAISAVGATTNQPFADGRPA
jgi:nucleoid DNA-binding protein